MANYFKGFFWLFALIIAWILYETGILYHLGNIFITPFLPANFTIDGGTALIVFLIFLVGGSVAASGKK
jgi:hypothetical protein